MDAIHSTGVSWYYRLSPPVACLTTTVIGYGLQRAIPSARGPFITPSPRHGDEKHGNVNPFLVGIPFRVSLRGRLTPG